MITITERLKSATHRVAKAAEKCGRDPKEITLLAVSKTKPLDAIREAADAGQLCFGENYPQEGADKVATLNDPLLQWHFIGPLQSNKTRMVAENFYWVHSLDRYKIAKRLNEQRPDALPPLQVCIQINIDEEESKSGIKPQELMALAHQIAALPKLQLRGLMAIPRHSDNISRQRQSFAAMQRLFNALQQEFPHVDTLSMGMSGDLESAIEYGATIVRVGTAIFGAREKK